MHLVPREKIPEPNIGKKQSIKVPGKAKLSNFMSILPHHN